MSLYLWSSYETIVTDQPTKLKRKEVLTIYGDKNNFIDFHNQQQNTNEIKNFIIEY